MELILKNSKVRCIQVYRIVNIHRTSPFFFFFKFDKQTLVRQRSQDMSYYRLGPQHLPLYTVYTKLGSFVDLVIRSDRLNTGDGFSGDTSFKGTGILTGQSSSVAACEVDSLATGLVTPPSVVPGGTSPPLPGKLRSG